MKCICDGVVLVSRQYVNMNRMRVEVKCGA